MKRVLVGFVAVVMIAWAGLVLGPAVSQAQNCQWDAAWFFGLGCNPVPAGPPLPPQQRPYDPQTNPEGHPWWWENDPGVKHWCPPECL